MRVKFRDIIKVMFRTTSYQSVDGRLFSYQNYRELKASQKITLLLYFFHSEIVVAVDLIGSKERLGLSVFVLLILVNLQTFVTKVLRTKLL